MTSALAFLPLLSVAGFAALGLVPTIAVLMAFQVLRRAGNFAVARPAREVLFTAVTPEDRYKTKAFIDTVVYRAGDQIGAWAYAPMAAFGFGIGRHLGRGRRARGRVCGQRGLARPALAPRRRARSLRPGLNLVAPDR